MDIIICGIAMVGFSTLFGVAVGNLHYINQWFKYYHERCKESEEN